MVYVQRIFMLLEENLIITVLHLYTVKNTYIYILWYLRYKVTVKAPFQTKRSTHKHVCYGYIILEYEQVFIRKDCFSQTFF